MALYVFYGEEDFLRDYNSNKIINEMHLANPSMNLIRLSSENIDKLVANCEQMPFMDEKKVIYVKDSGMFTSGKKVSASVIDSIVAYFENLPEYVVLIFNEESIDKRLNSVKKIPKSATVEEFKFRGEVDLANWIVSGMKKSGASMDIEVAKYLAECCGPSMSYLYSEIKKLAILAQMGEVVDKKLIDSICLKSLQGMIFDLTDKIGEKDKKSALKLLDELLLKKESEQFILLMLYRHFKNLFLLKVAEEEGNASAAYLGINPYVYKKLLQQVRRFSKEELREILKRLFELDGKSKKGDIDLRVGLEVILSISVR